MTSATGASAGGIEASRLDTKFMYEKENYVEMSQVSLDYAVKASNLVAAPSTRATQESSRNRQSRTAMAFKKRFEGFDIGLKRFKSGTVQLIGSAASYGAGGGPVPSANVNMNTLTLMSKVDLGDNTDLLLGVNGNTLEDGTVTTTRAKLTITGESNTSGVIGFAYSKPEIAMRIEVLMQPKSEMKARTNSVTSAYGKTKYTAANGCTTPADDTASFDSTLSRPSTLTLNIQSGVAADTVVFGSVHRTKWAGAQIDVPTGCSATSTASKFWNTTTYTIGAARKVSDSLALTASVAKESGGSDASTSLFTVNNGYRAINLGAQYTVGKVKISGGYNYTKLGDITINPGGVNHTIYTGNKVSAFALKVGINF